MVCQLDICGRMSVINMEFKMPIHSGYISSFKKISYQRKRDIWNKDETHG